MMKAKISPNLISFVTVRRAEWILKVSVYKNRQILVIAHHHLDLASAVVRCFYDQNLAADFIEHLVEE